MHCRAAAGGLAGPRERAAASVRPVSCTFDGVLRPSGRPDCVCSGSRVYLQLSDAPIPAPFRLHQVLLGDMGAGKSSLVLRFVKGQFFDYQAGSSPRCSRPVSTCGVPPSTPGERAVVPSCSAQESTIGAAFLTQTVSVGDATVKFEIWCALSAPAVRAPAPSADLETSHCRDTAGQERYHSLAPMYYRGEAAQLRPSACPSAWGAGLILFRCLRRRRCCHHRVRHHEQRLIHAREELGAARSPALLRALPVRLSHPIRQNPDRIRALPP